MVLFSFILLVVNTFSQKSTYGECASDKFTPISQTLGTQEYATV